MTQVLIQTKGFTVTPAIEETCHKCSRKLMVREELGHKLEFFLEVEGKGDGKLATARIKLTRGNDEIFVAEKAPDLYQAIREGCKKARQQFNDAQ